jgi:hypothetical protein
LQRDGSSPSRRCTLCSECIKEIALADRRSLLAKIAPGDLNLAALGQLAATQLALYDSLEPSAHAPLGCRRLVKEVLEDPARDRDGALILAEHHVELDGVAVTIPAGVFGKAKNIPDLRGEASFSYCSNILPVPEQ